MKKRIVIFLLAALFLLALPVSAKKPQVVDEVGVLSSSQYAALLQRCGSLTEQYRIDTIIVITNTLNGRDPQAAADDLFDDAANGYGYGSDYSGVLLLYAVNDRDFAISTYAKGQDALSDSQIDQLFETMIPYLSGGDSYRGLDNYLTQLESDYAEYEAGEQPMPLPFRLLIAFVIGLIAALVTLAAMKSKMQTANRQSGAVDYVVPGSFNLYNSRDIFLYSRTTKTKIDSNGSGGGHSSHTSSSGRSHGGGSRHF